jgi:hypothetical protein
LAHGFSPWLGSSIVSGPCEAEHHGGGRRA